jgi:hypothetical protein
MQRAIDEYEFRGPESIVVALNEVQTEATFNQPRLATAASSPAMVAFRRAVAAGAVTVSVVLNVAHLLQGGDSIAKIAADTYHGWQQIGSGTNADAPAFPGND